MLNGIIIIYASHVEEMFYEMKYVEYLHGTGMGKCIYRVTEAA
jgi:hypothetical protein